MYITTATPWKMHLVTYSTWIYPKTKPRSLSRHRNRRRQPAHDCRMMHTPAPLTRPPSSPQNHNTTLALKLPPLTPHYLCSKLALSGKTFNIVGSFRGLAFNGSISTSQFYVPPCFVSLLFDFLLSGRLHFQFYILISSFLQLNNFRFLCVREKDKTTEKIIGVWGDSFILKKFFHLLRLFTF